MRKLGFASFSSVASALCLLLSSVPSSYFLEQEIAPPVLPQLKMSWPQSRNICHCVPFFSILVVSDLSKTFSFQCLTTDLLVYYFPFQPIFHSGHQNNLLQLKSMSLPHFPMLLEEVRIIICLQGLRSCPPLPHTHSQDLLPVIAPNLGCLTSMSCLPCPLCL